MPKPGFISVTLKADLVNVFKTKYASNKKALYKKGITSFSGYIAFLLFEADKKPVYGYEDKI